MTARALTIGGYALLGLGAVVLEALARTSRGRLPTIGDLHRALASLGGVRLVLGLGWAWLGWHLLAR